MLNFQTEKREMSFKNTKNKERREKSRTSGKNNDLAADYQPRTRMCILQSVKGPNTQLKGGDCRLATQPLDLKNEDAFGKRLERVEGRKWKEPYRESEQPLATGSVCYYT